MTLCLIEKDGKVLLGMKKIGFGAGRWNGFGGKVDAGETIEQATRREVLEEAGLELLSLDKRGVLIFENEGDPIFKEVHIFSSREFQGEPVETQEMKPRWFESESVPFEEMWPDDRLWYPLLQAGKKFRGRFLFRNHTQILEHFLEEVAKL